MADSRRRRRGDCSTVSTAPIASGASLADALKRAKVDTITAKRPARAWASLVLVGEGGFRPLPNGRPAAPSRPHFLSTPLVAGASLVLVALAFAAFRFARYRRA